MSFIGKKQKPDIHQLIVTFISISCTGVLADNQININVSAEQQQLTVQSSAAASKPTRSKGPLSYQKIGRDKKFLKMKHGGK